MYQRNYRTMGNFCPRLRKEDSLIVLRLFLSYPSVVLSNKDHTHACAKELSSVLSRKIPIFLFSYSCIPIKRTKILLERSAIFNQSRYYLSSWASSIKRTIVERWWGGGTAGGRTNGREEVVRVSKWHVSVNCGQYQRRTSEGRPTFFLANTDKSISTRAAVSRFPAAAASTAGSLTHRATVSDGTGYVFSFA